MGESIISYINNNQDSGEICLLWFDDNLDRNDFLSKIRSQATKCSEKDLNADNYSAYMDFIKYPTTSNDGQHIHWTYVISGIKSLEWICQWVLSLHGVETVSIYIVDERISPTFFTDKVVCVGKEGVVKEAFYLLN